MSAQAITVMADVLIFHRPNLATREYYLKPVWHPNSVDQRGPKPWYTYLWGIQDITGGYVGEIV